MSTDLCISDQRDCRNEFPIKPKVPRFYVKKTNLAQILKLMMSIKIKETGNVQL
jgi:hypothetical protein